MKTKNAFLFAALILLGSSFPAFAQCSNRGVIVRGNSVCATPVVVTHTPTYAATEVITPVAIPVALPVIVPAFTYQYVPPVVQAGTPIYPGAPFAQAGAYPVQPGYPAQGPQLGYPGGGYTGVGTPGLPQYGQPAFGQPYGGTASYAQPQGMQYGNPYQQQPAPQQGLPGAAPNNDRLKDLAKLLLEEMRRQDAADAAAAQGGQDPGPPAVAPGGPPVGGPPAVAPGGPPVGGPPAVAPGGPPVGGPPVGGPPVGGPPVGGPGGAFPTPTVAPTGPVVSGGRPNPSSQFAQPAINALAKNCMSCHTGPGSKGDVQIFSQLNLLNPEAPFKTMLREIQQGRMPPRQSNWALTQQEYQALSAWLDGR